MNPNGVPFRKIVFQNNSTSNLTFYVDKVQLINRSASTTPAPAPAPAPAPTPAPAPVVSKTIFDDATTSLWQLSGWSSTAAVQGQFVSSGTGAVRVDATTWGGMSFDSRDVNWVWTDQPANLYTHLSFDVSAGPVVGAAIGSLQVGLDLGFGVVAKVSSYVPSFAAGTWYHVEIPLSVMNPNGVPFRKIVFQNNSTSNLTFYVDKVQLINRSASTAPAPAPAPAVQLQSCAGIMPLGDSITLGVNGGYRNNLYTGLQQNNCGVDFVGTQFDVNTRVADKDHEGHPGFAIGDIANSVNAWLASTQPNVILLMIGTNDTAWWTNEDATEIGARHNALIDQLRAARPNAWIFVASIPPQSSVLIHGKPDGNATTTSVDRAVLTQQLDAVIRSNVGVRVAAGQRVRFVDVNSVLTTADLYDGIHPTEAAHAKVAQVFLDWVRAALVP
jgi:lysophospholipase L1-like esterase